MTDQEVNKIIAEFMGWSFSYHKTSVFLEIDGEICDGSLLYTESLDALVPVWNKIKNYAIYIEDFTKNNEDENDVFVVQFDMYPHGKMISNMSSQLTIQLAAAHATAKCILELNK